MRAFLASDEICQVNLARSNRSHSLPKFMLNGTLSRMEQAVSRLLETHPVARIERKKNGFSIVPNDEGMKISVEVSTGRSLFVAFGCWSDYFDDEGTILLLISKALVGRLRVVGAFRGTVVHSHALEILLREGGWCEVAAINYVRFSLFPRPMVKKTAKYPLHIS